MHILIIDYLIWITVMSQYKMYLKWGFPKECYSVLNADIIECLDPFK